MKLKLTATLPDGEVVTRTTEHEYKFIIAVLTAHWKTKEICWHTMGWSSTKENAEKVARKWRKWEQSKEVRILPVEEYSTEKTVILPTGEKVTKKGSKYKFALIALVSSKAPDKDFWQVMAWSETREDLEKTSLKMGLWKEVLETRTIPVEGPGIYAEAHTMTIEEVQRSFYLYVEGTCACGQVASLGSGVIAIVKETPHLFPDPWSDGSVPLDTRHKEAYKALILSGEKVKEIK